MLNTTAIHMQYTSEDALFEALKKTPFNPMRARLRELENECKGEYATYRAKKIAMLEAGGWIVSDYDLQDYGLRERARIRWRKDHP